MTYRVLKFADALDFELHAALIGDPSFSNTLQGADFEFLAMLKQHIVGYILDQVKKFFSFIGDVVEKGIEWAEKTVKVIVDDVEDGIHDAENWLERAFGLYTKKQTFEDAEAQKAITEFNKNMDALNKEIADAQTQFEAD